MKPTPEKTVVQIVADIYNSGITDKQEIQKKLLEKGNNVKVNTVGVYLYQAKQRGLVTYPENKETGNPQTVKKRTFAAPGSKAYKEIVANQIEQIRQSAKEIEEQERKEIEERKEKIKVEYEPLPDIVRDLSIEARAKLRDEAKRLNMSPETFCKILITRTIENNIVNLVLRGLN